jgi:hypothetical protein
MQPHGFFINLEIYMLLLQAFDHTIDLMVQKYQVTDSKITYLFRDKS